jgi:hypothetical protein
MMMHFGGKAAMQKSRAESYENAYPELKGITISKEHFNGTERYVIKSADGKTSLTTNSQPDVLKFCDGVVAVSRFNKMMETRLNDAKALFGLETASNIEYSRESITERYNILRRNCRDNQGQLQKVDEAFRILTEGVEPFRGENVTGVEVNERGEIISAKQSSKWAYHLQIKHLHLRILQLLILVQ